MEVRLLQERYPEAIREIALSFQKNPGRCPVRARLFHFLAKNDGPVSLPHLTDGEFIEIHFPGEAGAQVSAAVRDLDGKAVMLYRTGAALASGAKLT